MTRSFLPAVLLTLCVCGAQAEETVLRLPVTRDTWVSDVGQEANANLGGSARLKFKSIQEMSLVDLDPTPLKGRVIKSAQMHLHVAGGDGLKRVTIGSLASEWVEGTSGSYSPQNGSSSFAARRNPNEPWAYRGSDLTAVILGNGGTLWNSADASAPDDQGWQTIAVDPRMLAARVAGISYGFIVFDDTGSEWTRDGEKFNLRLFPNRFAFSRESGTRTAPYFTIVLGQEDRNSPAIPAGLKAETNDLPAGEAMVSWLTPADAGPAGTIGFLATVDSRPVPQYLVPGASTRNKPVLMHLRDMGLTAGQVITISVRAVDGAGNVGAPAVLKTTVSAEKLEPLPGDAPKPFAHGGALPRLGEAEIAIIDALDKVQPVSGDMIPPQPQGYLSANHLWDTRQIRLQAARNEFVSFQMLVRGSVKELRASLEFPGLGAAVRFDRFRHVDSKAGPVGDPLMPMGDGLNVPDEKEGLAGQTSGSLLCEVYVPHEAKSGEVSGTLKVLAQGKELAIPVSLRVWDFALPDRLSFIPEMNCYDLPANELDYYRLAQQHRVAINRVPYSQRGIVADGCAPRWDASAKTLEFSAWDQRFGSLLDGSAFADLPRGKVPVEIFYLPLNENWPTPMEGNYNGDYWADRAFPQSYRDAFVAASRQFAEHFNDRKYDQTMFLGFFNGKNNFKQGGWSHGSCPWLLDEPANFQDFWALHFFGDLFHQGVDPVKGSARLLFRCDISRPQWQRDLLDDVLNYNVVAGGEFARYHRLVTDRKQQFGQIVLPYGTTNDPADSNVQPEAWSIDSWTAGGDGVLPWQVIGNASSWKRADATCLFYPGAPAGQKEPIPSIRLKAYLRGEQDVEYLALLSKLEKQSRRQMGQRVREALPLRSERRGTGFGAGEDAGMIAFDRIKPQDLWALRVGVGQAISSRHPPVPWRPGVQLKS